MKNPKEFLSDNQTAQSFNERLAVFVSEYKKYKEKFGKGKELHILDIGCGSKCELLQYIHEGDVYYGCDFYKEIDQKDIKYTSIDLNEESLAKKLSGEKFDVIFCGEVIEHLFSPDALIDDLKELMSDDGIFILSTPNLGYWVNRVLLLFGISPLYLENSSETKLGRRFKFLGQGNKTEGHIRLFTYGALREFVLLKGFAIIRVTPVITWSFFLDRIVCAFSRSLAPNNVFVLKKSGSCE